MKPSMKNTYLLFLSLFVGSLQAFSQTSETSSGKYFLFKNYSTQNGLINNSIWTMAQDRRGYIWIGSDLGLTRFDGKSFFHKDIPEIYDNSAYVEYIETTPEGNIISTSLMQGVFVQQDDGHFKRYLKRGYVELGGNVYNTLKSCPDGRILVSNSFSLYLLTPDSLQELYNLRRMERIFSTIDIDKDNRIWFGGRLGLGILQHDDTEYEPVFLTEFQDKSIIKILFDSEGTLHVGTTQGYYRIKWQDPSRWDSNYTIEQPFAPVCDILINHIYLDKEQNLWIPTSAYGVFRTKGDDITLHLTQENGLISSSVLCVMQDSEGNYWFGTNKGVSMIEDFSNYAITQNGVRFKEVHGITKDMYNRIWLYGSSKLNILQDDKLIPVSLSGSPIEKSGIYHATIVNSELIISNHSGLFQMPITESVPDLRQIKKIIDYPSNNITRMRRLQTDTTNSWIYSQKNIYNYHNGQFLPVTFNPDSILTVPTLMLKDKHGYYWYGDYTFGLYRGTLSRPDHQTLLFDNITAYKSLKADSAFVTAWIASMEFDKEGNLWFSTLYTGVYKLTIDNNGVVSDRLFSTANGLLSNNVDGIYCDDEGKLWFSTDKGINILKKDSSGTEIIDKLDENEGIEGKIIFPLQIDDRLFLLTDEGVYITKYQLFKDKNEKAPNVFITNLLINGIADSDAPANADNLRLKHTQNNLTIDFSAITFKNASDVRYRYKLEGADKDWTALSDRAFVEYASLKPGKYTFNVQAAMVGAQDEPGEAASLGIHILAPYYQTIWFYLLITTGLVSLLYIFFKYRMNHIIKMERMRMRIASDLHDDIGSTLSSISLISDIASRQDSEYALAKALGKIGVDSRVILNSMDDIIWSVNPKNDSLFSLTVRLREYAIPLCESKNIVFDMHVDETIYAMKLEMDERRNIFLIVKESVNNAVKHSGCSQLAVAFELNQKHLEIKISDNGCGFDPTKRGARNGVNNMERRAEQIGMTFSIKSEKDNGTTIMFKN